MTRSLILLSVALLSLLEIEPCLAADVLLGPVEERVVLDEFTAESQKTWQASSSTNSTHKLTAGQAIPGIADSVMQIELSRKPDAAGNAWFSMKRPINNRAIEPDADGVRLLSGCPTGGQWWIQITLHVGNEAYSHVLEPTYPARMIIEHVIPFEAFKSSGRALDRGRAGAIDGISIVTSVPNASLYLDRLTTYRQQRYASWLSFASSHPQHNIFEPPQPVAVSLTPGGTLPPAAKAFRYQVVDFYEQPVARGTVRLDGSAAYTLDLTPNVHGYYELRAWWVDDGGKDIEARSCIRAEGTLPSGIATFAVMPRTAEQNIARFKELGANAFFGLHGDFMGLADLMGLSWRFGYSQWRFLEPNKPDRSKGMAPWAAKILESEPPQPVYRSHVLPFCGNLGSPAWAQRQEHIAPPYANWEDYLAMVRDCVAVEKHRYPHMKPRLYGAAWEVNLNMPSYGFSPPYTPADVVELHRRARETIKSLDADALVLGPCSSNLNVGWFESVFQAGVLQYVDGIETHGYAEGVTTPEEYDYPGKLAAIRDLMRRHNQGKVLPIYITEAAFRGMQGSTIIHRKQAQVMTRLAIILKGEGVKVFLPFYGIDYDRDGWWGFCFNLEVDSNNPWGTKRISPKPTVNAMAACAGILEGATPVRRVEGLGAEVWAYLFERDGTSILAIWTPGAARRISLRVGNVSQIETVNIMGHRSRLPVQQGTIDIGIDGSPQYLIGISVDALP